MRGDPHYKIAVIPGDGIGLEAMPESVRVLEAAARRFGLTMDLQHDAFAPCDYHLEHGRMLPESWKDRLTQTDAIFFGAVGWPRKVPDHF